MDTDNKYKIHKAQSVGYKPKVLEMFTKRVTYKFNQAPIQNVVLILPIFEQDIKVIYFKFETFRYIKCIRNMLKCIIANI